MFVGQNRRMGRGLEISDCLVEAYLLGVDDACWWTWILSRKRSWQQSMV